jgi:hypothetical protein
MQTVLKNCVNVWLSNQEEWALVESIWVLINNACEWFGQSGDQGGMGDGTLSQSVLCNSGILNGPCPT